MMMIVPMASGQTQLLHCHKGRFRCVKTFNSPVNDNYAVWNTQSAPRKRMLGGTQGALTEAPRC